MKKADYSSYALYDAPFGEIGCAFAGRNALVRVDFIPAGPANVELPPSWQEAFDGYFSGSLKDFAYAASTVGTPFQQKVWQAIDEIPYGQTVTYLDIARVLQTSPRAVGNACGRNPLAIVTPCHRVVGQTGLGGFSQGRDPKLLSIKKWLLKHEGATWRETRK